MSQLVRLMMHIIKWQIHPDRRSRSRALKILYSRYEIEDIQEEIPGLNRQYIESIRDKAFSRAKFFAEKETVIKTDAVEELSWEDVYEKEY